MTRTQRQAHLRRIGRYTFEIASGTRPGVTHTQDVLHLTCSCEAGRERIRCWHLVRALLAEQGFKAVAKRRRPGHRAAGAGA